MEVRGVFPDVVRVTRARLVNAGLFVDDGRHFHDRMGRILVRRRWLGECRGVGLGLVFGMMVDGLKVGVRLDGASEGGRLHFGVGRRHESRQMVEVIS